MASGRHLKLSSQTLLMSLAVILVFLLCGCGGGGGSSTPTSNNTQGNSSNSDNKCSGSTAEQLCLNTLSFTSSILLPSPNLIAIDGNDKVWVGSQSYGTLTMIDPTNATSDCLTGCTSISVSGGTLRDIAIDGGNNIWLAYNEFGGTLSNRAVSMISPSDLTTVNNVYPNNTQLQKNNAKLFGYDQAAAYSMAIDNDGQIVVGGTTVLAKGVVTNTLEMIVIDNTTGDVRTSLTPPNQALNLVSGPGGIAIDSVGNTWVVFTDGSSTTLAMYPVNSQVIVFSGGGLNPTRIAVDNSRNLWVINAKSSSASFGSVTKIAAGASADCSTGCTNYISAKFLNGPISLAVDGANNVWVAAQVSLPDLGSTFSDTVGAVKIEQDAAADCSSGCTAYTSYDFTMANDSPGGIAVDGGGNVWIENNGGSTVVEFPQVAASTTTPIVRQTR